MNRTEKEVVITGLRERLSRRPNVYLTDFTGISVKKMTELRRRFRAAGVEYVVVKNTLAQRALQAEAVEGLDGVLDGPTGFVLAEDPVTAAKIIADFRKEAETFQVKAGLVEGRPVSASDVERLAKLPPQQELLAQLAGGLQAPLQGLAGVLNGLLYQVAGALEALRAKRADA